MRSRFPSPTLPVLGQTATALLAGVVAAALIAAATHLPEASTVRPAAGLLEAGPVTPTAGNAQAQGRSSADDVRALPAGARTVIERAAVSPEPGARPDGSDRPRVDRIDAWVVEPGFVVAAADVTAESLVGGGGRGGTTSTAVRRAERVVVTAMRAADGAWVPAVSARSAIGDGGAPGIEAPSASPSGPDVGGDQDAGAIVAEGSVLLPGSFTGDPAVRDAATDCPGCVWRLDLACPTQDICAGAFVGCEPMELRWLVRLLRPPATDFVVVGTLCRGAGEELLGVDALAEQVSERFVELLPRAQPTVQPSDVALVQIPAVFAAGEPSAFGPVDLNVVGYAVRVSAEAEWTWRFGDGHTLVTDSPGGAYPDRSVAHTFRRAGSYDATVTTRWAGEFTVNGDGPYPIAGGPVELSAPLSVQVREAGAVLVTP